MKDKHEFFAERIEILLSDRITEHKKHYQTLLFPITTAKHHEKSRKWSTNSKSRSPDY